MTNNRLTQILIGDLTVKSHLANRATELEPAILRKDCAEVSQEAFHVFLTLFRYTP